MDQQRFSVAATRSRRRLARAALVTGLLSIAGTLIAGTASYISGRNANREIVAAENRALSETICKVAAASVPLADTAEIMQQISQTWNKTTAPFPGAYLCVISPSGKLAVHSKKPKMKGTDVSQVVVSAADKTKVADLLKVGTGWSGQNTNFRGIEQLVGYHFEPQTKSLVAVHVPSAHVDRAYGNMVLPWIVGLSFIGGIVGPLALGLLFQSSRAGWNEAERGYAEVAAGEERMKSIVNSLPQLIWMSGTDKKLTFFNERWLQYTGRTLEQELRDGWVDGIHPEDLDRSRQTYASAFDRRERIDLEYRLRGADGQYRWFLDCGVPRYEPNGEFVGYVGSCLEITDRKSAVLKLAQSEARLRAIFEAEPECVKLVGKNGELLDMNPAGVALMEAESLDSVKGHCIYDVVAPEYCDAVKEMNAAIFKGDTRQLEFKIVGLNGTTRWMYSRGTPLRDADGQIVAQLAVAHDITQRRVDQEALRQSEQRYRSFVKASVSTVWVSGPDGQFHFPQDSWEAYTGMPWKEHQGVGWAQSIHPDDRERLKIAWFKATNDVPELFADHGRLWHEPSQEYHYFEVRAVPIYSDDGTVKEWVGATTDVHKQRIAEQELRQTQQELLDQQRSETDRIKVELDRTSEELVKKARLATIGQVSAQIAHDLRNPLGAVRNAAYYLKGEIDDATSEVGEFLQVIEDEVTTCDTIIRNLLEATRPRKPDIASVNACDIVRAAVHRLHLPPDVDVRFQPESEPMILQFDPVQLRQLLDNLLANARDAAGDSGSISIDLISSGDDFLLTVTDSGPGIASESVDRIFELLYTTKARGTGLGLPICRDIIERHGGTIQLDEETTTGASFTVRIPGSGNCEKV